MFFYQRATMRPPSMPSRDLSLRTMAASHEKDDGVECVVDFRATAIYIAEAIHCLTRRSFGVFRMEPRLDGAARQLRLRNLFAEV
jgi:hypothetical protein